MNPLGTPVPQLMAPQDPWQAPSMTPQTAPAGIHVTMPSNEPGQQGQSWITAIVNALKSNQYKQQLAQPWNQPGSSGVPDSTATGDW